MKRLDLYVLRLIAIPFVVSLLIAAALLFLNEMSQLFDFVLNENGPFSTVWRMIATQLPEYLSLGLPFGLFIGTLAAFRKLSTSSELDVMHASGISIWRLTAPIFAFSVVLMAVNFVMLGYLKPLGEYDFSRIRFEARSGALGARIHVGEFTSITRSVTFRVGDVTNGGHSLKDIFLQRCSKGRCLTFDAARGRFIGKIRDESLVLRLVNGQEVDSKPDQGRSRLIRFKSFDLTIGLPRFDAFRGRQASGKEATFTELLNQLADPGTSPRSRYDTLRGELHWRILHILTLLVLPFGAVPLGIANRRRDSGLAPALGVVMLILYIELLKALKYRVEAGLVSPWLSMWLPFLVYFAAGFAMTWLTAERPGWGAPAYVDAAWEWISTRIPILNRLLSWRRS